MIKLENYEVMGWKHAIRGMRNPMNSWDKSDTLAKILGDTECTDCCYLGDTDNCAECYKTSEAGVILGSADHDLMMKLRVYVDITAPLYWWKEFDTYKVGTVANSCSTMHKIHEKEFELEDFSTDHLEDFSWNRLDDLITHLNIYREKFVNALQKFHESDEQFNERKKSYWWQMIQLLPSSYNQKRTIMLNYEVLANIYKSRKNHKLDEWREFCQWIENLPYSEIITGKEEKE